jgi:hypothetical protein
MFDLLIHHFQTSNPDFVKGYGINVSLSNIGIHHTGIQGVVSDTAQNPIAGAAIKIVGTDKTVQTNLNGEYSLIGIKPADAQIEVSKQGYKTSTATHHFTRGHIDTFDVTLSV